MNWDSWIQTVAGKAVDVYAAKEQAKASYDVAAMQLAQQKPVTVPALSAVGGISPTVLLVGAVVLVGALVLANK